MGVSAIGYAFGRPESSFADDNATNEHSERTHDDYFEVIDRFSGERRIDGQLDSPFLPALGSQIIDDRPSTSARRLPRSKLSVRRSRRKSLGNLSFSLESMFEDRPNSHQNQEPSSHEQQTSLRPPYPLKKRLSAFSYSHGSSITSDSRPDSPSISFSNGSVAFSHAGSATPIFGEAPITSRPPNKLVKRHPSQKMPDGWNGASKRSSVRRPATSHQRSADNVRRSVYTSGSLRENGDHSTSGIESVHLREPLWKQYFSVKVSRASDATRKRGSDLGSDGIRRILPDPRYSPTLIMAHKVVSAPVEIDESVSQDHESSVDESRPITPPVKVAEETTSLSHMSKPDWNTNNPTKRSFSFSDLLGASQLSRRSTQLPRHQGNKLSRKRNSRLFSAPLFHSNFDFKPPLENHEEIAKGKDQSHPMVLERNLYEAPAADYNESDQERSISYEAPTNSPESFNGKKIKSAKFKHLSQPLSPQDNKSYNYPPDDRPQHARQVITVSDYRPVTPEMFGSNESLNKSLRTSRGGDAKTHLSDKAFVKVARSRGPRSTLSSRGPQIDTIFDSSPRSTTNTTSMSEPSVKKVRTNLVRGGSTKSPSGNTSPNAELNLGLAKPERAGSEHSSQGNLLLSKSAKKDNPISSLEKSQDRSRNNGPGWITNNEADEDDWSFGEDINGDLPPAASEGFSFPSPHTLIPTESHSASLPVPTTTVNEGTDHSEKDPKISIFDWSEQPSEKSNTFRTPPRPRTVHGKKDAEGRINRVVGRRAPSGLHARSQSVPAVPDITGKRDAVARNKFGTWGVGSKGVTEDWNDDFDFPQATVGSNELESIEPRIDSGFSMVVPKTIQEQQNNVLANIGLLREWGILIEELKTLRLYATSLGLLEKSPSSLWNEVDAMIDLADQEADDETLWSHTSPPSSPSADLSAFEDPPSLPSRDNRSRRKSVLQDDIFGVHTLSSNAQAESNSSANEQIIKPLPAQDSEAVARSVIEALQNRNQQPPNKLLQLQSVQSSKKVPFDTATLKHIVPYVNGLLHKVKEVLRDAEKLYSSPRQGTNFDEPFIARFYPDLMEESPTSRKSRRLDNDSPTKPEPQAQSSESELTPRMKLMKVM